MLNYKGFAVNPSNACNIGNSEWIYNLNVLCSICTFCNQYTQIAITEFKAAAKCNLVGKVSSVELLLLIYRNISVYN